MTKSKHTTTLMTMAQAKMIVWNSEAYDFVKVMQASIFILGSLNASQEDVAQARICI